MDDEENRRVGIIVTLGSTDPSKSLLAKELVRKQNVSVTLMALPDEQDSPLRRRFPDRIHTVDLTPILLEGIPDGSPIEVTMAGLADSVICTVRRPPTGSLIREIEARFASVRDIAREHRLAGLVGGRYDTYGFDVARSIGVPFYLFFDSSMTVLSHYLGVPVETPGSITLGGTDVPSPFQNERGRNGRVLYREAKGILVNSFSDLEPGPASALKAPDLPPVYPIGPFTRAGSTGRVVHEDRYLYWLDEQPPKSVLFISFGKTCAQLSGEQVNELALGLERSEQRFLWVLCHTQNGLLDSLLPGFQDRVQNVGLLIQSSAGLPEVLAHESIGAFVTDCEWYPVIESITHGVPLIAFPLSDEQKMNAVMLTERVKVGLSPNADENGLVRWEEITAAINVVMEGEDGRMVRDQMHMLKNSAERALTEEGSSYKASAHVAKQWKRKEHSLFDLILFCLGFYIVYNLILSVRN